MIRTIRDVCFSLVSVLLLYFVCVTGVLQDNPEKNSCHITLPTALERPPLQQLLSSVHKLVTLERFHYI